MPCLLFSPNSGKGSSIVPIWIMRMRSRPPGKGMSRSYASSGGASSTLLLLGRCLVSADTSCTSSRRFSTPFSSVVSSDCPARICSSWTRGGRGGLGKLSSATMRSTNMSRTVSVRHTTSIVADAPTDSTNPARRSLTGMSRKSRSRKCLDFFCGIDIGESEGHCIASSSSPFMMAFVSASHISGPIPVPMG